MRMVSGGQAARVVMAGVGSSARQVLPPVRYVSISTDFSDFYEMGKLSVGGFDFRTDVASPLKTSLIFGGRLVPQGNEFPTYQYKVNYQKFDGATMVIETVVAPSPKAISLPSMLVVACDKDTNALVGVEYGNNGIRIIALSPTALLFQHSVTQSISAGSILRVERFLNTIQVFVNGVRIAMARNDALALVGHPGVGTYSWNAPNVSTSLGPTSFYGGTSLNSGIQGREYWDRTRLPHDQYTEIARMYIPTAGRYRLQLHNARWMNSTAFSARNWVIRLNNNVVANWGEQNGIAVLTTTRDVPANSLLIAEAHSNGQDPDRVMQKGWLFYETAA